MHHLSWSGVSPLYGATTTLICWWISSGATCSGKTTLAKHLKRLIPDSFIIHQDVSCSENSCQCPPNTIIWKGFQFGTTALSVRASRLTVLARRADPHA